MERVSNKALVWFGVSLVLSFGMLGYFIQQTAVKFKAYERVVTVKGLSEREYPADTVIWPIQFTLASNNTKAMFDELEQKTRLILDFLTVKGLPEASISLSSPTVIDRKAQQYGNEQGVEFRYIASRTVTVYSESIDAVRAAMNEIGALGKLGVIINQDPYANPVVYSFTKLNDVKPSMVEEATKNAREVAEKFAKDSQSSLGKIKRATQGQFSIYDRDSNTPHIKRVRVVSTVEYYLSD